MDTKIKRKKNSRKLKNARKMRKTRKIRKTRKMYKKKGGDLLKTVKILIKPSALSNAKKKNLVSSVTVSDTPLHVDEILAEIVAGRKTQPSPYYFKEIEVKT